MEPDAPLSPFAVPNKRSSWQQRLLRYTHRHFASFLSQWKSMHSPLLVDFHSFCRILLPSEYQCKSQVPLTNAPRPTAVTSRLHANASSTHEELDASREAYNPSTSLGSSRTTELVHRKVESPGKGNAGYWPHLRDANLPLQADGGMAASGEGCGSDEAAGITETAQLQKLAEDVWAAFQDRGGLEIFQVLGGMAWLLPTCLNAKARAFCSIFDITGTGVKRETQGLRIHETATHIGRSNQGCRALDWRHPAP
ncbi:leucine rich repeat [Cystoisospora suis]|uniref:Leucine rich repeat n=1 Tax=Cystoisospora suis TaxID=483139 RepID=A0A2C6L4A7_9APIC|nr:leucine rich repeat [Cystoisospora suis]